MQPVCYRVACSEPRFSEPSVLPSCLSLFIMHLKQLLIGLLKAQCSSCTDKRPRCPIPLFFTSSKKRTPYKLQSLFQHVFAESQVFCIPCPPPWGLTVCWSPGVDLCLGAKGYTACSWLILSLPFHTSFQQLTENVWKAVLPLNGWIMLCKTTLPF